MRHNIDEDLILSKPDGKGKDKIIENNGSQAVFDKDDQNVLAKKTILQRLFYMIKFK